MSDDLYRRVENLESTTRELSNDLKKNTEHISQLTSDISLLTNNIGHLTNTVQDMTRILDRTHQIELDLVELKSRTNTIGKLWEQLDIIKEKVAAQSPISNAVKIIGVTILTSGVALVFAMIASGGIGG